METEPLASLTTVRGKKPLASHACTGVTARTAGDADGAAQWDRFPCDFTRLCGDVVFKLESSELS